MIKLELCYYFPAGSKKTSMYLEIYASPSSSDYNIKTVLFFFLSLLSHTRYDAIGYR